MNYYFAPLEGITGHIYRRAHSEYFPGIDKYFAPFISTNQNHRFTNKEMKDILPENNPGLTLVPQLLGKVPSEFIAASKALEDMGYGEVNLNLGCPSNTVVAKNKGSGMLKDGWFLYTFLDKIFSECTIKISIKTRLGISSEGEFENLMEIYNRYPLSELIIHPRVQKDFYKGEVRLESFGKALNAATMPVCYNGDLLTPADCDKIQMDYPKVSALMLGRGLVGNPSLVTEIKGGGSASKSTLRSFNDRLFADYKESFKNDSYAMMRMKEIWLYMSGLFTDGDEYAKAIRKSKHVSDFESAVDAIFRYCDVGENSYPEHKG